MYIYKFELVNCSPIVPNGETTCATQLVSAVVLTLLEAPNLTVQIYINKQGEATAAEQTLLFKFDVFPQAVLLNFHVNPAHIVQYIHNQQHVSGLTMWQMRGYICRCISFT